MCFVFFCGGAGGWGGWGGGGGVWLVGVSGEILLDQYRSNQMSQSVATDLGLYWLLRTFCLNTLQRKYGCVHTIFNPKKFFGWKARCS